MSTICSTLSQSEHSFEISRSALTNGVTVAGGGLSQDNLSWRLFSSPSASYIQPNTCPGLPQPGHQSGQLSHRQTSAFLSCDSNSRTSSLWSVTFKFQNYDVISESHFNLVKPIFRNYRIFWIHIRFPHFSWEGLAFHSVNVPNE